ncbi:prolactin regulatory element-binding protein-like [Oppia nitens]|uniref:prolactin regulatory element-binding protein-like n=1 Tax=Oppia nitens TaxID=1686743 RepID=UPI0023DC6EA2|nr:prolactin regulatory element-binding protein-like [Oppia nitens]
MSQEMSVLSHLLARVNFPIYSVRTLSERHILVAGGGGPSKTGVANNLDVYELVYDSHSNSCKARLITHYDTGSRAVMNMCVVPKDNYCYQLFCGGMDGLCTQYDLKLNVESRRRESSSSPTRRERSYSEVSLRRRRLSSRSESLDKENDINASNSQTQDAEQPVIRQHSRKDSKPKMSDETNGVPDFTFDIKQQKFFKTDFNSNVEESFQKIVKFSSEGNMLITGGSDGHIRLWSLPKLTQILVIKAHTNEVDDLDINSNGTQIVSVSRDSKGFIWNTSDGKLKTELIYELPKDKSTENGKNGVVLNKYIYRGCRYVPIQGDTNNYSLVTIMNPLIHSKPAKSSYICKWSTQSYKPELMVSAGNESLSTISVSDDGRFIGVGTLTGSVDVYIAFSLQRVYHLSAAHNIFVTAVEFLKSTEATQQLTGGNEASLVSVSVDNHIVVHHIPKRATLGFLGSTAFFIIFMLIIYILMSYLGI